MKIAVEDLTCLDVHGLLEDHLADMRKNSPPGASFALDLEALRAPDVTFWTVREKGELLGCGALKMLDEQSGELKSMKTARSHLRKGVATYLLSHILDEARQRGYRRLYLETGSAKTFESALVFYEQFGFVHTGPFADYKDNGFSVFMTIAL